jgi:RNA polymerase sigma-70 factor (ECF subfamily)
MNNEETESILAKLKNGEREGLDKFFNAYFDRLLNYAFKRCLEVSMAQDIASQTILKIVEKSSNFKYTTKQEFEGWLFKIAENELKQTWRKQNRNRPLMEFDSNIANDEAEAFWQTYQQEEKTLKLLKAVKSLSLIEQQIISLFYFENLSYAQVGAVTGKSESAVKTASHRAIKKLKIYFLQIERDER